MRYQEVVKTFKKEVLPQVINRYGENDRIAILTTWNDWTDSLAKSKVITEKQFLTWPNPFEFRK